MDALSWSAALYWVSVLLYAAAAAGFLAGVIWRSDAVVRGAALLTGGTLAPHAAAIALRWSATGHGPYINRYEVFSSDVWVALAVFTLFHLRFPRLRLTGAAIVPAAFLLLGAGALATNEVEPLPPSLRSWWLVAHVGFAKLALSSITLAFGVSVLYLLKRRAEARGEAHPLLDRLPSLARLDELNYRCTGFGFVSLAIMIASGSIWANNAWGNYWSWDAIESWALATWIFYGINLHLRTTFHWRGDRAAWMGLATLAVSVAAFKFLAYLAPGAHIAYLAK